ncbi:hypothetical protein L1887_29212 [Cichorium endivia]|nr:hypothetical protein L1887_29212 [Cichorium endivia]
MPINNEIFYTLIQILRIIASNRSNSAYVKMWLSNVRIELLTSSQRMAMLMWLCISYCHESWEAMSSKLER